MYEKKFLVQLKIQWPLEEKWKNRGVKKSTKIDFKKGKFLFSKKEHILALTQAKSNNFFFSNSPNKHLKTTYLDRQTENMQQQILRTNNVT